jgi:hypothetical protein
MQIVNNLIQGTVFNLPVRALQLSCYTRWQESLHGIFIVLTLEIIDARWIQTFGNLLIK